MKPFPSKVIIKKRIRELERLISINTKEINRWINELIRLRKQLLLLEQRKNETK